ncbi:terminase small subunit [Chitinophaga sp.]|uniref:terminase small subunit n=1 Tax=Chitinophaga sp. TaxID=1869181 RepID=UPI0031E44368
MSNAGRPMKFSEPAEIQNAWEEFKVKCDNNIKYEVSAGKVLQVPAPRIYTLGSFQVYIGISRESWGDYKTYPEFSDTINAIEAEVLARKADALVNAEGSTQGLKFDLMANYGWQEKQAIEQKVELTSVEVKVMPAIDGALISTSEKEVDI